jgi:pimeloyl-ACP methyl ester carboxylesterase
MKKNILIKVKNYTIDLITNGVDYFDKVILCFHGFNGDKWGGPYAGLKNLMTNSLVCSFDSCGHGDSEVSSEDMRLDIILEEINVVVTYLKNEFKKPIIIVANSYGAYRVMWYLIQCKPQIRQVIFVNPAFRMLNILENIRNFDYNNLKNDSKILMKSNTYKYLNKRFIDDLHSNNLYEKKYDINYNIKLVVGRRDSLIPINDTLEIAQKYHFDIKYIDEEHRFENKDNWKVVASMMECK